MQFQIGTKKDKRYVTTNEIVYKHDMFLFNTLFGHLFPGGANS